MYELYLLKKYWIFIAIGFFSSIFCLILLCGVSTGSSESAVASAFLVRPFEDNINFVITSHFGERPDPIEEGKITFHSGIDMSAPEGTNIVASGEGKVIEVGYSEEGLGNYVYIEHDLGSLKMYTMYGHMLDNSIVVTKGQKVKQKDKIGIIGNTGRSTGVHLHFMVSMYKLSLLKDDLVDPIMVIEGL